jgi:broad specificity phosphatase PhoE
MKKIITIEIPHVPFYFVRHGQTDWNRENKVMGQIDIPLNAIGLQQAQAAAKNIAQFEVSHIVSSPLKRAMQTSEIIAAAMSRPITVINELTQNALGVLEGRNKAELINGTAIDHLIEHWKMGGDIEGAEHWSDFVSRISVGLNSALAINPLDADEKPILIVAHKPVLWALLHILDTQIIDMNAKNCAVYFFRPPSLDSQGWTVSALSEKD